MIGPSKILTVSYGTFSCTLEGFDDPFSTMRAIAEYFRDLAAEDRYFGATPPTPDAEMLHRIAEREVQRRVEARVGDHGIVLRAGDGPAAAPVASPVSAPVATPVTLPQGEVSAAALAAAAPSAVPSAARPEAPLEAPGQMADEMAEETADRPEAVFAEEVLFAPAPAARPAAPAFAAAEAADHDSSDVAAKLLRIRAVIAAAQAARAAPPAAESAAAPVFEDDEEPLAFAPAPGDETPEDADATGMAGTGATVDDDFGFDLELDDLPARPAAEAAAEPAGTPAGIEEVATEAAEDLAVPAIAETEPGEVESGEMAPGEMALGEPVLEEAASVAEGDEVADEDIAGEAVAEDATADEPVAIEAMADEPVDDETVDDDEALVGSLDDAALAGSLDDAAMDDEDYAALALATLTGAQVAAADDIAGDDGEEIRDAAAGDDAEDGARQEDDALAALDLSGWRIGDEAVAGQAGEVEASAAAAETAPGDDRRPGFFERARARVIRIRRGAAPVAGADGMAEAEPEPAIELAIEPAIEPAGAEAAETGAAEVEAADEAAADIGEAAAGAADDTGEETGHAAIFAALNGAEDEVAAFEDEPAEAATAEADEDAAILAGIGAAIGAAADEDEPADDEDEALLDDLAALARDSRREAHEGRAILEDHAGDGEASVERLMEEAKSKLEGVESRRRFSAIAHLKAAVAATVADRKLKSHDVAPDEGAAPAEDIDRYRDDLSKAVRPRRPTTEGAPVTRRPALSDRPAPLVLVSEQRVDIDEAAVRPSNVIRPRRVGAAALTVTEAEDEVADETPLSPEEARNFAEFADRLGAASLAELLEAAAAYTATVEGMPHFSRPHILKKVSGYAEEDEFTREDGLRSFGMLLRQGKIQKISRGQFTITESSRFMSEARRVAR